MTETATGKLFIFDGPDGAGKTTQIGMAKAKLEAEGYAVHATRSHGGTPIGEALRIVSLGPLERNARTDMHISLAMHSELIDDIKGRQKLGEIILMDRGPMAIWAYQVYGSGLAREEVETQIDDDYDRFDPTLTFCYVASLKTLRHRMTSRPGAKADYFEQQEDDYFERVIDGYRYSAARYGALLLDAEQHQEVVHAETMRHIHAALGPTR